MLAVITLITIISLIIGIINWGITGGMLFAFTVEFLAIAICLIIGLRRD